MKPWLEIILPVRNPSAITLESIASLAAQTRRNFAVLISDNHSAEGLDVIKESCRQLKAAGIPFRVVRPERPLGLVEHWNWAHSEARADWLKPLFAGDLLRPRYVEEVFQRTIRKPKARFIRCEMESGRHGEETVTTNTPFPGPSLRPEDFLKYYPHLGNWIGAPVNVAYHRLAWQMSGGYRPQLPRCASLQLYVTLILRHGLEFIPMPLAVLQLHTERFSPKPVKTKTRSRSILELWLILRQVQTQDRKKNLPLSSRSLRSGLWVQFLQDYWYPFKKSVKRHLRQTGLYPPGA